MIVFPSMRKAIHLASRNVGDDDEAAPGATAELYNFVAPSKVHSFGDADTDTRAKIVELAVSPCEIRHHRRTPISGCSSKFLEIAQPRWRNSSGQLAAWDCPSCGRLRWGRLPGPIKNEDVSFVVERPGFEAGKKAL